MTGPDKDGEQLRILSILYYVWGGLGVLFSILMGIYGLIFLGVFATASKQGHGPVPPAWFGIFMATIAGGVFLIMLVLSGLSIWTGICLARRSSHTFCTVVAALTCLSFPIGTALGVFSLIVLTRASVKALFTPGSVGAAGLTPPVSS